MRHLSLNGLRKTLELEYPVHLQLEEAGNSIHLNLIIVEESKREMGYGTEVMKKIIEYADTHRMNILLTPSSDYGSNLRRLKKFYKRFNFKKQRNRYYSMVRPVAAN